MSTTQPSPIAPTPTVPSPEKAFSWSNYADEWRNQEDGKSEASSNPTVWDNNIPRKMLDMQWYFSANPLRVADCSGKHWSRLHATYKAMIPQPGGGVLFLKQRYPHVTDEELYQKVYNSGVAKPRQQRQLPPLPPRPEVNTPLLRQRLKEAMVPPLPRPEKGYVPDDGSSIFSRTQVAPTTVSKATSKPLNAAGGSVAGKSTVSSKASSVKSRMEALKAEIEKERTERQKCTDELSQVSQQLSKVEALLNQDDKPKTKP
jgi:hypothetical protein